ncbi:hypothetical protein [Catenulispora subtropica]|uniref:Uncharacterized protein n=1 Tax=Catenulispora subtropica TaxID=450798 RepID=A0ABP5BVQ7_9ACTN
MTTTTQPWLRAELISAPETTPGAQLMIPADGVEFHDDQLVFHHQGEVVYVADQGQLRSITWFAKQPNPELARRKALWPNHGTRWTDPQRTDLLHRLRLGQSWAAISTAAGRSRTGCQQEAIKQGWIDPDTLKPLPALFTGPFAPADATPLDGPAAEPAPQAGAAPSAEPAFQAGAAPSAEANAAEMPTATPAPPSAPTQTSAPAATTPHPGVDVGVPDRPDQPSSDQAPGFADVSTVPTDLPPQTTSPAFSSTAADPTPPPDPDKSPSPGPDIPPSPPRIPRQRTGSGTDPDPHSDIGPGDRLLNHAQPSLAGATLAAYLNPPKGHPTGAT